MYHKITKYCNKIKNHLFIHYNKIKLSFLKIPHGHNTTIFNSLYINKSINSQIIIGDNLTFTSGNNINPLCRNIRGCLCTENNSTIKIGNNVGISSSCIWAHKSIIIGNNVCIGGDCIIMDSDSHSLNYKDRRDFQSDIENTKSSEIIIEDDVLIGTRSIILKGVTIGARSVIGAGSIVTKDIPSDSIASGNPCKVIRKINN